MVLTRNRGAKTMACPVCGATKICIVPRWGKRRPDYWFSIHAPRECSACGAMFIPVASDGLRRVTVGLGVLFLVCSVAWCIPPISALVQGELRLRWICALPVGGVSLIFGVHVIRVALARRPWVLSTDAMHDREIDAS